MAQKQPEDYHFEGFVAPKYTATPDQLFDELLAPGLLTEAELRVLLYIVRRTFGWKKDSDAISLAQITDGIVKRDGERVDWGAGIAKSSAVRAVKGLVDKGIVVATRHQSAARGFEATTYTLQLREPLAAQEIKPETPLSHGETRGAIPLSYGETRVSIPLSHGETRVQLPMFYSETRVVPEDDHRETRASSAMKQALVSPRNIQETYVQETIKQENDSNQIARENFAEPAQYSPWIAGVITDYSRELGDMAQVASNVSQALNIWRASGRSEEQYVQALYEAKQRLRKAQGGQGAGNIAKRMAYFFKVLRQTLELDE